MRTFPALQLWFVGTAGPVTSFTTMNYLSVLDDRLRTGIIIQSEQQIMDVYLNILAV